ncbi:MAG TPA: FkbM family methyltransferase [Solirubrobacterales bacterium]
MKPYSHSLPARIRRGLSRAFGALLHADRRRAFVRELFYRAAARFTPGIVVESEGLRYVMSTGDHGAGMTLFMGEDVDRGTLASVVEAMERFGGGRPDGGAFVDVGANVGTTTVTALGAFGFERAYCFEPFPGNVDFLRTNLEYNGLGGRAKVIEAALSDHAGSATFEISPKNPGDARVRPEGKAGGELGEESWPTTEVKIATLDSFIDGGALDTGLVTMLWIDAQGHEGHILAGAGKLLAKRVPTVIEFWPYALRRAGGFELLEGIIDENFTAIVDLDDIESGSQPPGSVAELEEKYWGIAQTDLLLIP